MKKAMYAYTTLYDDILNLLLMKNQEAVLCALEMHIQL